MSTDNFGITLIEQLKNSCDRCRHQSPDTIREDGSNNDLLLKIKNIDHEKRKIVQDFIQCLVTLHADVRKENDIVLINIVDQIFDEIKKAKNYLMSLIKQASANEIGKELFKLIFQNIKDSIESKLDFENVIKNLTDIILSELTLGNTHLIKFLKMFIVFLLPDLALVSLSDDDVYSQSSMVSLL